MMMDLPCFGTASFRVLLLGTSKQPFDCEMKGLASTFQKIVLLPRPDYASRNGECCSDKALIRFGISRVMLNYA